MPELVSCQVESSQSKIWKTFSTSSLCVCVCVCVYVCVCVCVCVCMCVYLCVKIELKQMRKRDKIAYTIFGRGGGVALCIKNFFHTHKNRVRVEHASPLTSKCLESCAVFVRATQMFMQTENGYKKDTSYLMRLLICTFAAFVPPLYAAIMIEPSQCQLYLLGNFGRSLWRPVTVLCLSMPAT